MGVRVAVHSHVPADPKALQLELGLRGLGAPRTSVGINEYLYALSQRSHAAVTCASWRPEPGPRALTGFGVRCSPIPMLSSCSLACSRAGAALTCAKLTPKLFDLWLLAACVPMRELWRPGSLVSKCD